MVSVQFCAWWLHAEWDHDTCEVPRCCCDLSFAGSLMVT